MLSLEKRLAFLEARSAGQINTGDEPTLVAPRSLTAQTIPATEHSERAESSPSAPMPPRNSSYSAEEGDLRLQLAAEPGAESTLPTSQLSWLFQSAPASADPTSATNSQHMDSNVLDSLETFDVSLPRSETAHHLIRAYFQFANLSQPILFEPHFRQMVDHLYDLPRAIDLQTTHTTRETRTALFFVLEVFAVAVLVLQKQEPTRIPTSMADRYHKTALEALKAIGLPSDVVGVQALLLMSQYFYHHPIDWQVWKTVGAAIRLAIEIGLHEEPDPFEKIDFRALDVRRRTFWVAYAMDRNLAIALGRPVALADGAIGVQV